MFRTGLAGRVPTRVEVLALLHPATLDPAKRELLHPRPGQREVSDSRMTVHGSGSPERRVPISGQLVSCADGRRRTTVT
ncbi:MAG: hypothetical protein WA880_09065 [Ornithinimicrobium sp.]